MHKSRFAGFIIDCQGDDLADATRFWGRALGYDTVMAPEDDRYVTFRTAPDEPHIELQRVSHPSRVHIDIEADDIEAEVSRLEALGAKRVRQVKDWWVMEAPTGHRFCVVPAVRTDFDDKANTWP
jgi:hypothetical protein